MLSHYIIVRRDLSPGEQLAYVVHAAGESAYDPVPSGTRAVVLAVPDAASLETLSGQFDDAMLGHKIIREDEVAFSIGLEPVGGPEEVQDLKDLRRITSSLPLAG